MYVGKYVLCLLMIHGTNQGMWPVVKPGLQVKSDLDLFPSYCIRAVWPCAS